MLKQDAYAAASNSSGLVPLALSNRVGKEYTPWKAPDFASNLPFPLFNPPSHVAEDVLIVIVGSVRLNVQLYSGTAIPKLTRKMVSESTKVHRPST